MIHPNFVLVGVALQLYGGYSYFLETLKGHVKPNRVTWLIWGIAPLIAFSSMISQGVGILSLATFVVGFVPLVIFFASFFNRDSVWKIQKLDIICGTLSIVGLVLWLITRVGNIAILLSIGADTLAAIPTIVKSYKYPETENSKVYFYGVFTGIIALLTVTDWSFQNYAFPLYIVFLNMLIGSLIKFRWRRIY